MLPFGGYNAIWVLSYQASREGRFAIFTLFGIMSDLRGMGSQYCYVLFVHVTIWATRA